MSSARRRIWTHAGAAIASFALGGASASAQFTSASPLGTSNPFLGDAGAAFSSPIATASNPANASFIDHSQVETMGDLYRSETYFVRYPGSATSTRPVSGLRAPISVPYSVFKPTPRIGIGGFAIPNVGLSADVALKRLPIALLGTVNYLDIVGKGTLRGIYHGVFGYRLSRAVGIGVNFHYLDIGFDLDGMPSGTTVKLLNIKGSFTLIQSNVGIRYDAIPDRLMLGLSASVLSKLSIDLGIRGPTGGSAGDGAGSSASERPLFAPLERIIFGAQIVPTRGLRLLADIKYDRADKNEKTFSLIDFREKKREEYDTISLRLASLISASDTMNILAGYHREPAKFGQGGRGEDSLAGYGSIDLILVLADVGAQIQPYNQYALGVQFGLLPKSNGKNSGYFSLVLTTGLVYKVASLGVDEKGELPGAYALKSVRLPIGLTYRF